MIKQSKCGIVNRDIWIIKVIVLNINFLVQLIPLILK
jgi:hypothetical protein